MADRNSAGAERGDKPRVITTRRVLRMKEAGEKIAMLTAYDYLTARILDQVGVDIILVGDSVGNVVQGHEAYPRSMMSKGRLSAGKQLMTVTIRACSKIFWLFQIPAWVKQEKATGKTRPSKIAPISKVWIPRIVV